MLWYIKKKKGKMYRCPKAGSKKKVELESKETERS